MDPQKKLLLPAGFLLFFASLALSFLIVQVQATELIEEEGSKTANSEPQAVGTIQWQSRYTVCALYDLDCAPEPLAVTPEQSEELKGLALTDIALKYPIPEWTVRAENNQTIIIKNLEGLCPLHKEMYHLGPNESGEYIAVYYGPGVIGAAGGAYLVTDTALRNLPEEEKQKIAQGSYEFVSQEDLISLLDSFSEM